MALDLRHKSFEQVYRLIKHNIPVILIGPAGSGKSVLAAQVAKELDKKMVCVRRNDFTFAKYELDPKLSRNYYTPLYWAYKEGNFFLLDDACKNDLSLLASVGSLISSDFLGWVDDPSEKHDNYKNFRFMAALTTDYCLHGSSMAKIINDANYKDIDNFAIVEVDYDQELERKLFGDNSFTDFWLDFIWELREHSQEYGYTFSTRMLAHAIKLYRAGFKTEDVLRTVILKGVLPDRFYKIRDKMSNCSTDNPYMEEFLKLKIWFKNTRLKPGV